MAILLRSKAFENGQPIPLRHTGDGEDLSPPLSWVNLPGAARQLALMVDDPDAPGPQPWVHWILCGIPPDTRELPEGIEREVRPPPVPGSLQGRNSWGTVGYRGPAPPRGHGRHRYRFRLYALDATVELQPGLDSGALLAALSSHILEVGELTGTYQR